ncbi:MAG: hypothetical protein HP490_02195 [Nitrospira sp.]|nr:hypothetical protein [Nitrospira sp.]
MSEQNIEPLARWERSPNFRAFFCNYFKFRFNVGDVSITFSQYDEDPGSPTQNIIREQMNITMSWAHLKQFGTFIDVAVKEMEREVGPIPNIVISEKELQEQAHSIIKGFVLRKQ